MPQPPQGPVTFDAVNKVLTKILDDWKAGNSNTAADLSVHGPKFQIDTAEHLKTAIAKGQPLIQPEIIGKPGLGKTANIVLDLTTGLTTAAGKKFPPMPQGGLNSTSSVFLDIQSPEIQTIIAWIEGGCLS